MTQEATTQTTVQKVGIAVATASAAASAASWILLVLLSGNLIPRATLVGAILAITLALCAYRAARAGQVWVLLVAATFGTVTPVIENASGASPYVGFLAMGYAIAAMLLLASASEHRRVG